MTTPVYSRYRPTHDNPRAFVAEEQARWMDEVHRRNPEYEPQLLPWPMEELVGTAWRNLPTRSLCTVVGLAPADVNHPQNGLAPISEHKNCKFVFRWNLGVRHEDRLVVNHYVRVDHLPPAVQLAWFDVELDYYAAQLLRYEGEMIRMYQNPDSYSCWGVNLRHEQEEFTEQVQEAKRTLRDRAAFARLYNLPDTGYWPEPLGHRMPTPGDPRVRAGETQLMLL